MCASCGLVLRKWIIFAAIFIKKILRQLSCGYTTAITTTITFAVCSFQRVISVRINNDSERQQTLESCQKQNRSDNSEKKCDVQNSKWFWVIINVNSTIKKSLKQYMHAQTKVRTINSFGIFTNSIWRSQWPKHEQFEKIGKKYKCTSY